MLFQRKRADEGLMRAFWTWFAENEEWIIAASKTDAMAVVNAVDQHLSPAFACYKWEIEFLLGYNNGVGEFAFYHLGKKALLEDGKRLGELMPGSLRERWQFSVTR